MNILVLHGSSRDAGNTEQLTNLALEGVPHTSIRLREKSIRPIHDQRHDEGGFDAVADDYDEVTEAVLAHDFLIFSTPIYWYGMSGHMKNYVDRWSQSMRDKRYSFKESLGQKQAYVITTGGDQPRLKGLPLIQQFQYVFSFVGMLFAGYMIGEGNKPGDVWSDQRAVEEAKIFNAWLKAKQ
ncbi:flavodoxin family protein [Brevibacillus porteri]|uniref:Flavodoxin family protein n=1 Tax=Brevibacillus porteri TaxID=2126350 RepID=A0ABX5FHQ2_9BACL|nr:flavodoxin family protein [Brevibacillus porteri]MED1801128.1 flavodoxin family protein [Brevibacillus porteri]MED2131735.1 flavodoxin family protein [Brevibacillus porteri]MED2743491.1 flavodoxin family protein [Brevibacillus porteri]MED2817595.1 flavodoxin family protein [Brevibacillus porteri]MED2897325.1 flavodoxin family protein [Brevibacillus porteri]